MEVDIALIIDDLEFINDNDNDNYIRNREDDLEFINEEEYYIGNSGDDLEFINDNYYEEEEYYIRHSENDDECQSENDNECQSENDNECQSENDEDENNMLNDVSQTILSEIGHNIILDMLKNGTISSQDNNIKCKYYVNDKLVKAYSQDFKINSKNNKTINSKILNFKTNRFFNYTRNCALISAVVLAEMIMLTQLYTVANVVINNIS